MSAVRVTVLMENTAPEGLLCEHGLSLMIEHGGRSILLDAGSSAALLDNAARLGVDLSRRAPSFFPASGSCPTIRRAWRAGESGCICTAKPGPG